jgi:beta-glucosidase
MKAENTEQKALKKAYKKAKRKTVTLWKTLGIITLVFALILTPLTIVLSLFDNTVAAMLGGSFWELKNEDPNALYFKMDFNSNDAMYKRGDELCYQVEAEGAVLLMNNGALPLAAGSKVSTLSSSSVNIVYGGTGSGNVDASAADDLKTALEKSGFSVNPTLWDFYKNGAGSSYNRTASAGESAVLAGQCRIAEVPMNVYGQDVLDSIATYGDAVIITLSRVGGEGYDLTFQGSN